MGKCIYENIYLPFYQLASMMGMLMGKNRYIPLGACVTERFCLKGERAYART